MSFTCDTTEVVSSEFSSTRFALEQAHNIVVIATTKNSFLIIIVFFENIRRKGSDFSLSLWPSMLKIVAIMLCGMAVGFLLRGQRLKFVNKAVTVLIWALLFFLGVEVGQNPQVLSGISNLGLEALWISLMGLAGTILFSWALWRWVNSRKGGQS